MPFRVSGKNIDVGEALRTKINTRIAEVAAKYFDGGYSGHVTVGKDGFGFRTECVVHLDSGIVFEADAMAADAYASAEQAARIEATTSLQAAPQDHQVARSGRKSSRLAGGRKGSLLTAGCRRDPQACRRFEVPTPAAANSVRNFKSAH
jgi:ribosomal subunit interface protein